jgi:hypothetical protein
MSRLHGYILNVPMMRDYENTLVAIVGRDGKATGEVGGRPLVPVDRERFCRTCRDGRSGQRRARHERQKKIRRRLGEKTSPRRPQRERAWDAWR